MFFVRAAREFGKRGVPLILEVFVDADLGRVVAVNCRYLQEWEKSIETSGKPIGVAAGLPSGVSNGAPGMC